ncbi:MAG: hypothetical protein WBI94_03715 [Candidatus Cloacimonadaceae bacterium]
MKKYLLIVVAMMAVSAVFAFQPSSMLIGGTFEFKSEKDDSDADAFSTVAFYPQLSGFVIENLSADLIVNILSQSTDGYKASSIGLGAGARYFFRNLYGGADFTYAINNENEEVKLLITTQKTKYNAMYLTPKIGYLAPILPNTYIDLQGYYKLGLGEYTGDYEDVDNEESCLGIRLGVQFNLNI